MSRRARRNHSPAFKAKVALAAIKGDRTVPKLETSALIDHAAVHHQKQDVAALDCLDIAREYLVFGLVHRHAVRYQINQQRAVFLRQIRVPTMASSVTESEQTLLNVTLFVNVLGVFRVALAAHNGLLAGSHPTCPLN